MPGNSQNRLISRRARSASGWGALVVGCYVLGNGAKFLGVPAPHLLVGLLVGVAAALTGLVRTRMPPKLNRAAQAMVGVLMGSYLAPDSLRSVTDSLGPLALTTAGTIVLCLAAAVVLPRLTAMRRADAILGMIPGGSAAIIACADDVDADARIVAFMQYARVALVAVTAPLVVLASGQVPSAAAPARFDPLALLAAPAQLVSSHNQVAGLTVLAALCFLGMSAGRSLALPAPALLGPMLLAGIALLTGAVDGFAPEGMLQDVVFVLVGMDVGLRFSRSSLRQVGRCAPLVLATTAAVCAGCACLAALLHVATGITFTDAYLATTPGGINAVLATAASVHADLPLVSAAQSVRLFTVVLLAPPFIRWAAEALGRQEQQPANTKELIGSVSR